MSAPSTAPLEGIRVLELAHLIAGPICGMYLADMGADVIKVESRGAPDAGRTVYGISRGGEGILHLTVNRNKRSLCPDLAPPQGCGAFHPWGPPRRRDHGGLPERRGREARHRLRHAQAAESAPDLLLALGLRAGGTVGIETRGPRARARPGR